MRRLRPDQARRAVLGALGLGRPRPEVVDVRHLRRVYADLGIIQIDPINVLARAHHQVVMSRLGPVDVDAVDHHVWRSGEVYEGWVHVDATTTVDAWPLLHHRRARTLPWRAAQREMGSRQGYLAAVLEEVRERGELSAAQLSDPGERTGSWGTRSLGRAALDHHHARGDLAISWRDRRMTAYFDLVERVIPARVLEVAPPDPDEAERALLARAARAMGVGTAADLADHHRQHVPTSRRQVAEMAADGRLTEVRVDGWRLPAYADPDLVIPRRIRAACLLNPFDPALWNRDRVSRLFGLEYRVEIYVPAAARRYGYYVLPFLLGEDVVALVDLRHDRRSGRLLVAAAHRHDAGLLAAEPGLARSPVATSALAAELRTWASWVGATDIAVLGVGDLAGDLAVALS